MYDALVVGAGPAGVSAALWLKQLGFNPLAIDKNKMCGGLQLSNPYTNTWIATSTNVLGPDVAHAMHQNMLHHKVAMQLGICASNAQIDGDGIRVELSNGKHAVGRCLVLAGGVVPKTGGFAKRLGMIIGPGHSVKQTNFSGARVAILGGGDSAFENYGFAKSGGARDIKIFARTLKARAEMLEKVAPEEIVFGDYEVDKVQNTVNGEHFDMILVLYGYEASKASLIGLDLAMRPDGFVATDGDCLTSVPKVFAIGEIAGRWHPCCVTAMADGVVAAKAIQRLLEASAPKRFAGYTKRAISLGVKALL